MTEKLVTSSVPSSYQPTVRPRLIFMTTQEGSPLLALLEQPGLLDMLAELGASVALGLPHLDAYAAMAATRLTEHGIPLIAWLMPLDGNESFHAQNYPQARSSYVAFTAWSQRHHLQFEAVGFDMAPPPEVIRSDELSASFLIQRFWRASDNVLFPAARAAYAELMASIRHDGYEVHIYQWPVIADDRRAGTTLIQRALEIVDTPADLDVLMCVDTIREGRFGGNLGGALIAAYGPTADALGVVIADEERRADWGALQRNLLLAAQHTDTIYIDSLEDCLRCGFLPAIHQLDWAAPSHAATLQHTAISLLRSLFLTVLLTARFGPRAMAWAGWIVALILWLQRRRTKEQT